MKLFLWVALGTLVSPALCQAQAVCPWINAETAMDAQSGSSILANQVTISKNECRFHYRDEGVAYELRVVVQEVKNSSKAMEMQKAKCTSKPIALSGIGNEAVLCGADTRSSHGEQVIGRVRDSIFAVTASDAGTHSSPATSKLLADKAESSAEQVAGNLF